MSFHETRNKSNRHGGGREGGALDFHTLRTAASPQSGTLKHWKTQQQAMGRTCRSVTMRWDDFPSATLPLLVELERGGRHVLIKEKTGDQWLVEFSDSRECYLSDEMLKTHLGSECHLVRNSRKGNEGALSQPESTLIACRDLLVDWVLSLKSPEVFFHLGASSLVTLLLVGVAFHHQSLYAGYAGGALGILVSSLLAALCVLIGWSQLRSRLQGEGSDERAISGGFMMAALSTLGIAGAGGQFLPFVMFSYLLWSCMMVTKNLIISEAWWHHHRTLLAFGLTLVGGATVLLIHPEVVKKPADTLLLIGLGGLLLQHTLESAPMWQKMKLIWLARS